MFSTILKPSFLHNAAHKIFYNMPNQHFLPCTQILTRKQGTCGQKQESAQGGGKCGSAANECGSGKSGEGGGGSCMKITYQPYKEYPIREHDEKNMTLKRPMSPHLDVYRMTMSALTSILQRATGIVLTMSAVALAGGTLFLPDGVNSMVQMVQYLSLPSPVVILGKFLLAFPFTFHYFNGIRFCLWNAGKMLDMQVINASVSKMFVLSVVLALAMAAV